MLRTLSVVVSRVLPRDDDGQEDSGDPWSHCSLAFVSAQHLLNSFILRELQFLECTYLPSYLLEPEQTCWLLRFIIYN